MYTIIGGDQKEYGPISADDVRQWIAEGRLNEKSLVKAEGETEFRALGTFPDFISAFVASQPVPRLSPPTFATGAGQDGPEDDPNRAPELRLGECLAAGWTFLAANSAFLAGAVFLTWLANFVFVFFSIMVPLLGPLVYLCFGGVIMGGFYLACLRRMRGETVSPVEVFSGFKVAFGQLVLVGLISSLLTEIGFCFCIVPAIYLAVAWAFAVPLVADKKLFFWSAMELSRKVVTRVWFEVFALLLIAFLPMAIFQVLNMVVTGKFFLGLYDQSGHNWQQLAQTIPGHTEEMRNLTVKMTLAGQAVLLVNLFYCAGVMMRAYENLFGTRKP